MNGETGPPTNTIGQPFMGYNWKCTLDSPFTSCYNQIIMKYTMSVDGVMRVTRSVQIRLTKDELAELAVKAKNDGITVTRYLERCLRDGLEQGDEEDDPTYANTGENDE